MRALLIVVLLNIQFVSMSGASSKSPFFDRAVLEEKKNFIAKMTTTMTEAAFFVDNKLVKSPLLKLFVAEISSFPMDARSPYAPLILQAFLEKMKPRYPNGVSHFQIDSVYQETIQLLQYLQRLNESKQGFVWEQFKNCHFCLEKWLKDIPH